MKKHYHKRKKVVVDIMENIVSVAIQNEKTDKVKKELHLLVIKANNLIAKCENMIAYHKISKKNFPQHNRDVSGQENIG